MRRSETGIFRQISPGLALLLLGETDEEGFPTAMRTLIKASYQAEQELGRKGELISIAAESVVTLAPTAFSSATPSLDLFQGLEICKFRYRPLALRPSILN